jgi:hypothetical protein
MTDILMSSRRTICDGEVVTFAREFVVHDGPFGGHDARGPFEVSASRESVMVHRAVCNTAEQTEALLRAIRAAENVRRALEPHWRGGHPSQYPEEPTIVPERVEDGERE